MNLKHILSILGLIILLGSTSCSDDKNEPNEPNDNKIEYYVKYELSVYSRYQFNTVTATLTTEKGITTMEIPRNWDGTFGPFDKLEKVILNITFNDGNYNTSSTNGRISICRGNQPYILKADKSISNAPLQMEYQITALDVK